LCISWGIKNFDNIKVHGMCVKITNYIYCLLGINFMRHCKT
jgi:hypothetical protein